MMENHAKRSNLMPFYSDFKQSLKRGYIRLWVHGFNAKESIYKSIW